MEVLCVKVLPEEVLIEEPQVFLLTDWVLTDQTQQSRDLGR